MNQPDPSLPSRNPELNCSPMVWPKEWQDADPEELGEQYVAWVHQLTAQDLHAKADIATVLAILSNRIKALSSALIASENGRNQIIEECAKICDSVNNHDNPMTALDCADAIRALKGRVEL